MVRTVTQRRRFLAPVVNSIQGVISGTLAVLLGGAVVGPSLLRRRETWLKATTLDVLTEDEPTPITLRVSKQDGFTRTVERYATLCSTCTHLGRRVGWDSEAKQLKCPCHGGVYDRTGAVLAGPPVLRRLP
jgi:Rieske Fe-S protein